MPVDTSLPYGDPALAATYDRITAPALFARPARDLVDRLAMTHGARALDVGTGTGIVRELLEQAVGPDGSVIGVDASIVMLSAGRVRARSVAARVPGLPFRPAVFDFVTAGFVLSHVSDPDLALADMVRVCRTGGRIGITAWGSLPNPAGEVWSGVAATVVPLDLLAAAFKHLVPSEERLSRENSLAQTLGDAGLIAIVVTTRDYTVRLPVEDFVTSKAAGIEGVLIRRRVDSTRWGTFLAEVTAACRQRFGATVEYRRDFLVGVGTTGVTR